MHICYLCDEYLPSSAHGGIGTMVQTLGRAMVARGHSVTIVGIYHPELRGATVEEGMQVIRLSHTRAPGGGFLINGSRLRRALTEIHAKLPIDVLEGPELSFAFLKHHLPYPTVIRMNGGHHFFSVTLGERPRLWRSWLEARSFARASHLCAVSKFVASNTSRLLHLKDREIEIIPNPVDVETFCPPLASVKEDNLVLFVGTVCEKKGIRQLIEAMPRIIDAVPGARLLVCGRDTIHPETGRSFTEYLRGTLPAGIDDRVVFQGAVDHAALPQTLAKAAVCVYPSHMEALPLAWLEGLAMGQAVVASSTGPGPEVIEDGVSGLLCNPHDPASIAEQVIAVLTDRALRERLGQEARRRAVTHFGIQSLILRNEAFYNRTCNPLGASPRLVADPTVKGA